jgi:AMMECR1 domain-containing protein
MNNLDLEALCHTCFSTLDDHLNHKNPKRSSLVDQISCPVFVTWKRWNQEQEWELRGCIGTFVSYLNTE